MSDLVGNPEDRFSRVEAHISRTCFPDVQCHVGLCGRFRVL